MDIHPLYEVLLQAVRTDAEQMGEEGHDVAALQREIDATAHGGSLDALAELQRDFWHRPSPGDSPYDEPENWAAISATFPEPESHARFRGSEDALADRLLGAWQGRCAGCQLGKPYESAWPDLVQRVAKAAGSWPISDYVAPLSAAELAAIEDDEARQWLTGRQWLARGNFDRVAPDDDIHYAIVALSVLRQRGAEFTADDVADELLERCLRSDLYASGLNMFRVRLLGLPAAVSARFGNPCRQSLGAMIRCDAYGWTAPARPALAARMAWQDAVGSQTRNGIYAGMFFAALMADVLAHGDVVRAIETASGYVPPRSRFAEMVAFIGDVCDGTGNWQEAREAIYQRYDRDLTRSESVRFNHCLPNAAIVLLALRAGGGDFTRTLGVAVMAGMDTDCNAATAGSIMGCALGAGGIADHWITPLHDTVETRLRDYYQVRITELARQTLEIARRNVRHADE